MVNKVHCAYCDKELDRLVFCNASHKVMYHRKEEVKKEIKIAVEKVKPFYKERKIISCKTA